MVFNNVFNETINQRSVKNIIFSKPQIEQLFHQCLSKCLYHLNDVDTTKQIPHLIYHQNQLNIVAMLYFVDEFTVLDRKIRIREKHIHAQRVDFIGQLTLLLVKCGIDVEKILGYDDYGPVTLIGYVYETIKHTFIQKFEDVFHVSLLFQNPFMEYRLVETSANLMFYELQDYRIRRYYEEVANGTIRE